MAFFTFRSGRSRVLSKGEAKINEEIKYYILLFLLIIFLVVVPLFYFKSEYDNYQLIVAIEEVAPQLEHIKYDSLEYYDDYEINKMINKPIFLQSGNVYSKDLLSDPEFNLLLTSMKLKRNVEFCQWEEIITDSTTRDDDGHSTTVRTYSYIKGWHKHPIISTFFDQPFSHHNPLRNPYSYKDWTANQYGVGEYTIQRDLINRIGNLKMKSFTPQELNEFQLSEAHSVHNFNYLPDSNYFYSPYEEDSAFRFARGMGQWLEGSLFDYQIGDIFNVCTPGDIRIYYEDVNPKELSLIGRLVDSNGNIDLFHTSRDYEFGLIYEGIHSSGEVFQKAKSEQHQIILIARLLLILWSLVLVGFRLRFQNYSYTNMFLISSSLTLFVISITSIYFWSFTLINVIVFIGSCLACAYSYNLIQKLPYKPIIQNVTPVSTRNPNQTQTKANNNINDDRKPPLRANNIKNN
eukprot:TRINITY_DN2239_c1_g5_i1.p1 TRINITY_DN2239_c1_g5~~TRINITY_DN2239_c1_g5_i1.p1  ORF type:complete len:462 (-),score=112.86 TRINITY_DN2239_c1_g5_i1:500-1885(-)